MCIYYIKSHWHKDDLKHSHLSQEGSGPAVEKKKPQRCKQITTIEYEKFMTER